jgi:hypothetical protein
MTSKCLNLNHNITITHPYKQQQQAIMTTPLKLFLSSTLCIISSTRFHIHTSRYFVKTPSRLHAEEDTTKPHLSTNHRQIKRCLLKISLTVF